MNSDIKPEIIGRIAAAFGLKPNRLYAPQAGYRNRSYRIDLAGSQSANLIIYKSEPGILRRIRTANALGNYLGAQGLPTRSTLDPRILRLTTAPARYASLYRYLPGTTIPWEAYTMEHIKTLGTAMAHMHAALLGMPPLQLPRVTDEYSAILTRMRTYFANPDVTTAITQKLRLGLNFHLMRDELLLRTCTQLPMLPLHMDFVRGNILFSPGPNSRPTISGILDFEKAALGHPAFDIARTLAFLLVDCKFKSEAKVRKYFLYSGYHKRGEGALPSPKLLEALVDLFLIYDFYKFLRHNPYEYLSQNEHFIRTTQLLEQRQIVHKPPALI